jgi:hypothetical protein
MAYTLVKLSGSTDGRGIKVVASSTPGTTIHQAASGATLYDKIWLWAYNSDTTDRLLSLEWGGQTAPDDIKGVIVPATTTILVSPGWILRNSLNVTAFAAAANVISLGGHAIRQS